MNNPLQCKTELIGKASHRAYLLDIPHFPGYTLKYTSGFNSRNHKFNYRTWRGSDLAYLGYQAPLLTVPEMFVVLSVLRHGRLCSYTDTAGTVTSLASLSFKEICAHLDQIVVQNFAILQHSLQSLVTHPQFQILVNDELDYLEKFTNWHPEFQNRRSDLRSMGTWTKDQWGYFAATIKCFLGFDSSGNLGVQSISVPRLSISNQLDATNPTLICDIYPAPFWTGATASVPDLSDYLISTYHPNPYFMDSFDALTHP